MNFSITVSTVHIVEECNQDCYSYTTLLVKVVKSMKKFLERTMKIERSVNNFILGVDFNLLQFEFVIWRIRNVSFLFAFPTTANRFDYGNFPKLFWSKKPLLFASE